MGLTMSLNALVRNAIRTEIELNAVERTKGMLCVSLCCVRLLFLILIGIYYLSLSPLPSPEKIKINLKGPTKPSNDNCNMLSFD